MIRTESSIAAWKAAQVSQDWKTVDAIETEWAEQSAPEIFDYPGDEKYVWEGEDGEESRDWNRWTDEDESALDEWEEQRRECLAIANEY